MTLVPVDPVKVFVDWARPIVAAKLPGWTVRARLEPGVTPSKTILIKATGGGESSQVADRPSVALQAWADDGVTDQYDRTHALRIVVAEAKRGLRARAVSGYIPLEDPTNPERFITQVTVTALLRGEDQ